MTATSDIDLRVLERIDSRLLRVIEETAEDRAQKIVEKCLKERDEKMKEQRKKDIKTMTKEFCASTTAHGVNRVAEADTTRSRIIWTVILITCVALFVYQSAILIKSYFEYPVNVDIKVVDNKKLTFPSVTVCNNNRILLKRIEDIPYKINATFCCPPDSYIALTDVTFETHAEALNSGKCENLIGDLHGEPCTASQLIAAYNDGRRFDNWGWFASMAEDLQMMVKDGCPNKTASKCYRGVLPTNETPQNAGLFCCAPQMCVQSGCTAEVPGCSNPLGMESGKIHDHQISASSSSDGHPPEYGRLNSMTPWKFDPYYDESPRFEVDFGKVIILTGIIIQGDKETVQTYAIQHGMTSFQWIDYIDEFGEPVLFCGHVDGNGNNFQHLPRPVIARHVAILPRVSGWGEKNLRVEFLGCEEDDCIFAHALLPMMNTVDPSSISCSSNDCVSNVTTYRGTVRSAGNAVCQDWTCPNRHFDFCLEENFCRFAPQENTTGLVCPSASDSGLANLSSNPCQTIAKCPISENEDEPVFPTRHRFYQHAFAAQYCEERGKQLCSLEELVLLNTIRDMKATEWGWIRDSGLEAMFEQDCTNATGEFCFKNKHTPNHARLNSRSYWKMDEYDATPWIQVDLRDSHVLAGVITQGGGDAGGYVTSFSLSFSVDGNQWQTDNETGQLMGNKDGGTPSHVYFPRAVAARYIRLYPLSWKGRGGFRLEIVGCRSSSCSPRSTNEKYVQFYHRHQLMCSEPECIVGRGLNYRGKQNVTRSGRPCQKWNSHDPQYHCTTPSLYPDADLSENYCRNIPDHPSKAPWCFTGERDWEYCHVERCEVGCVDLDLNAVAGENDWGEFLLSSNTDDYTDITDFSMATREEIAEMGHQKEDLILQCTFDKERCSLDDFKVTQNAKYGNCFTFNHGEDDIVRNTTKVGAEYGLKLTLSIESNEYVGLFGQDIGAKVTIHSVGSTPFPEGNAINTKPGESTFVSLKRSSIKRRPYPYGDCTSHQERDALYGGRYTYETCQHSCLQAALLHECGCSDELIAINSTLCSVLNKTQECCRQDVRSRHEDGNLSCDCRQSCNEDSYALWLSSSLWPSDSYAWYVLENIHTRSQAQNLPLNPDELRQNLARIHVYFRDLNYELITENPTYTEESLLSGLGGLLGLYVGLSVITVFEFINLLVDLFKAAFNKEVKDTANPGHNI
ncbi:PREDICTED: uncharacterized protein LOC109474096 [Branchiostoma belcheri]|uniref:Uncharacterized protein LOC109474096 n=1 Tax=Branchiostoma belcheri TaxID=7741 RepID=A0A6P4ZFJ4_BRABE|nr:PREDICTED: uncharacterized protein LOC109474096 [Branchiostoma belcheri]